MVPLVFGYVLGNESKDVHEACNEFTNEALPNYDIPTRVDVSDVMLAVSASVVVVTCTCCIPASANASVARGSVAATLRAGSTRKWKLCVPVHR